MNHEKLESVTEDKLEFALYVAVGVAAYLMCVGIVAKKKLFNLKDRFL